MPRRPGITIKESPSAERRLVADQRVLSELLAQVSTARRRRDQRLLTMWRDQGYEHRRLAELLSVGAAEAGGRPLSEDAVQKAVQKAIHREL